MVTFFKVGAVCFAVIALMSIFELIYSFPYMTIYGIIRSIFSLLFNIMLAYYFYWLIGTQPKITEEAPEEDIQAIIEKIHRSKGK